MYDLLTPKNIINKYKPPGFFHQVMLYYINHPEISQKKLCLKFAISDGTFRKYMIEAGNPIREDAKNSSVLALAKCGKVAKMLEENPGMLLGTATKNYEVTSDTYIKYATQFGWPIPQRKKKGGYANTFGSIGLRK